MEGMLVFGPQGGLCERYDIMTAKELRLDDLYLIVRLNAILYLHMYFLFALLWALKYLPERIIVVGPSDGKYPGHRLFCNVGKVSPNFLHVLSK